MLRFITPCKTTQDITDTATVPQTREGLQIIDLELAAISDVMGKLAKRYRDTPMTGRSNLQQAVPITFGYKMAGLLSAVERHRARLAEIQPLILVGEFAGASGTLASIEVGGLETQAGLMQELVAGRTKNTLLAGRYNFGFAEGSLGYAVNKGAGNVDSKDIIAGMSAPFGPHRVLASYIRHDDKTPANRDAHQWAVGYLYGLSKRTDLYIAYARINNDNGAAFKVGNATDTGTGDKAFNLGVRHTF